MNILNFPQGLETGLVIEKREGMIRFAFDEVKTGWMDSEDSFIERISYDNLNHERTEEHIRYEILMKNRLDEGISYLNAEKYAKAIRCLDDVIYYDSGYSEALLNKSYALYGQGHFVKSLRCFKRSGTDDEKYYSRLVYKSEEEKEAFPDFKRFIYEGDEYFEKDDYINALESYNAALKTSSKFNSRILSKLFNKKANALLYLAKFKEALESFSKSLEVKENDQAYFGKGCALYKLMMENPLNRTCESCIDQIYLDEIRQCFKRAVRINKKQLITKADILHELNCDDALKYYEEFLKNHFTPDNDYIKAASAIELGRD